MISELEKKIPDIKERRERETAESLKREGLKAGEVEPWEDGYRTKDRHNTFEWWYFDAEFEDGGKTVVTINTSPLTHPKGPLRPSILLIMKSPEGKSVRLLPEFKAEELSAATDSCDVRLGENRVNGDLDRYEMHVEIDDCAADLVFTREGPSWRPGSGMSYSGKNDENYFGWVVPVTYGTVEGSVVMNGEERRVSGNCYHDHNWGNISPGSSFDHWYWGRAHVGDFSVIFVEEVTKHLREFGVLKIHTFLLARGEEVLIDDGLPLTLDTDGFLKGPLGKEYPTRLDWAWEGDEGRITITLRDPELIESVDLLEEIPPWARPIARLLVNPCYYDFDADIELTVDLKGVRAAERGKALYELMMLR